MNKWVVQICCSDGLIEKHFDNELDAQDCAVNSIKNGFSFISREGNIRYIPSHQIKFIDVHMVQP